MTTTHITDTAVYSTDIRKFTPLDSWEILCLAPSATTTSTTASC